MHPVETARGLGKVVVGTLRSQRVVVLAAGARGDGVGFLDPYPLSAASSVSIFHLATASSMTIDNCKPLSSSGSLTSVPTQAQIAMTTANTPTKPWRQQTGLNGPCLEASPGPPASLVSHLGHLGFSC